MVERGGEGNRPPRRTLGYVTREIHGGIYGHRNGCIASAFVTYHFMHCVLHKQTFGSKKCEELEPEKRHANRCRILAFQRSEWYLEICRGGQETLGTSGGVLLPKTKLDQSRPNPGIVLL
ncbi:hypothetical protein JHK85_025185 [Glycine max]|nr:hypothetical protein JHK85_025185 [Glycine max]